MYRTLAFAGLALALATLPAAAQMVTISPHQIGQIFCISRLGNDMAPIAGLLTPSLTEAIADAEKNNADWEQKHPGDKPPLGDGIPWQTWQDYAPQCAAGNVDTGKDGALVEINYAFPDSPDANFTDKLHLTPFEDQAVGATVWRIDNIQYANAAGDLRSALVSAFAD